MEGYCACCGRWRVRGDIWRPWDAAGGLLTPAGLYCKECYFFAENYKKARVEGSRWRRLETWARQVAERYEEIEAGCHAGLKRRAPCTPPAKARNARSRSRAAPNTSPKREPFLSSRQLPPPPPPPPPRPA